MTRTTFPRAVSYVVLPYGGYPDTASDYLTRATRADVERELTDYGWMDNPAIHVFKVTAGMTPEDLITELVESRDPYPDYVVERGPRGGIVWNMA